jgi:hypothetical protein
MYAKKYENIANETEAPTQGATGGLAVTPAKNSTATITPSSGVSTGPPSSNETTSLALTRDAEPGPHETPSGPPSGTVLDVPKIRLEPRRVSARTKSKGTSSFGWRMV